VNELKLDFQEAIIRLQEKGWSRRAIARELGINRETVGRYLSATTIILPGMGDPAKVKLARRLGQETTMTLAWIASHLLGIILRGSWSPLRGPERV
jgi:orotate phosphoribosyltransferase-like protein